MADLETGNRAFNGNGAEQRARQMRLAGGLFIFGALFGLPSTLILADVGPEILWLTGAGIFSGLLCLVMPWERLSPAWIHAALLLGIAEVSAVAVAVDSSFLLYFVIIGVFASYVFSDRQTVAIYIGLISLVVAADAVAFAGEDAAAVQLALLTLPTILISAVIVAYLRESLEESRLTYKRFAEEAMELAARLRGESVANPSPAAADQLELPDDAGGRMQPPARPWPAARRFGLALGAALLAIPVSVASLAAAGVHLPDAATAPFEEAGISLLNQEGSGSDGASDPVAAAEASRRAQRDAGERRSRRAPDRGSGGSRRQARGSGSGSGSGSGGGGAEASGGPQAPSPAAPQAPLQPAGGSGGGGLGPSQPDGGPIDRVLRDTIDLLNPKQQQQP